MESSVLFPPVKRPIYTTSTTTMPETTAPSAANPTITAAGKRPKPPQPPLYIPQGHVAFRLLCHASHVGGLIGKSGSIIKQLQQLTGCKIRVEDPVDSCDQRIISVLSSAAIIKKIKIRAAAAAAATAEEEGSNGGSVVGDEGEGEEELFEVSAAQEGMVRVFERVVELAAEDDSVAEIGGGVVSCRLLAWKNQAGAVIGKGGKVVEKIRKETGCKVKVLGVDRFFPGAMPADEIVEIEGNVLAVKKALVLVTSRLQECAPLEKPTRTSGTKPLDAEPSPPPNVDPPLQRGPVPQSMSVNHLSGESENISNVESYRTPLQEVVIKVLCFNERIGCIIGKGGSIVKALQNDSGAHINVGPTVPDCDERMICISAMESVESEYSPAQHAAVLVFNRSVDPSLLNGFDSDSREPSPVAARVLVPSHQVGCLLGKGGAIISEIRQMTGASLRIFGGNQVPKCASEDCEVLQITGEFANVQNALYRVTGRLRDNIFSSKLLTASGARNPFRTESGSNYEQKSLVQGFKTLGISNNIGQRPTQNVLNLDTDGRLPSITGGIELGSGSRSAIVTNTTVEIAVPDNLIGSIYGENGSNLNRLRQISGAKVVIREPHPGTTQTTVIISGTPDQTQAAQSLLQAFILAGS